MKTFTKIKLMVIMIILYFLTSFICIKTYDNFEIMRTDIAVVLPFVVSLLGATLIYEKFKNK